MKSHPFLLAVGSAVAFVALGSLAFANVVRPAPDFAIQGGTSLRSLRGKPDSVVVAGKSIAGYNGGHPIVLIIAQNPKSGDFRKQVADLERKYSEFAARDTIFVAAFTHNEMNYPILSNIPFVMASNGFAVASDYGVSGKFALVVIGRDGNIDLATSKVSPSYVVRDTILNNYELQAQERRL